MPRHRRRDTDAHERSPVLNYAPGVARKRADAERSARAKDGGRARRRSRTSSVAKEMREWRRALREGARTIHSLVPRPRARWRRGRRGQSDRSSASRAAARCVGRRTSFEDRARASFLQRACVAPRGSVARDAQRGDDCSGAEQDRPYQAEIDAAVASSFHSPFLLSAST